jgi:hypothetical protein
MEDDGAGVFGNDRPNRTGSIQLSSKIPLSYRRELKESRPTNISDEFARAVGAVVLEERAFEAGEFLPHTSFSPRKVLTKVLLITISYFPFANQMLKGDPLLDTTLTLSGWFEKLSSGRKGDSRWQKRWFELICNRLYYYKDPEQGFFTSAIPLDEVVRLAIAAKVEKVRSDTAPHEDIISRVKDKKQELFHEGSGDYSSAYEMTMTSGRSHGRICARQSVTYLDNVSWFV